LIFQWYVLLSIILKKPPVAEVDQPKVSAVPFKTSKSTDKFTVNVNYPIDRLNNKKTPVVEQYLPRKSVPSIKKITPVKVNASASKDKGKVAKMSKRVDSGFNSSRTPNRVGNRLEVNPLPQTLSSDDPLASFFD